MSAIAVTVLHRPADPGLLAPWLATMRADCQRAQGFMDCVVSEHGDDRLQLAVAVSFDDEADLSGWLDGSSRGALLDEPGGYGIRRASSDLVIVEGELTPPGVAVFRHTVAAGRERDFAAAQAVLAEVSAEFTGYEGTVAFPMATTGEWLSLLRFRTERQLSDWLDSGERHDALPSLRSTLEKDFSTISQTTPLGTTVRIQNGRTEMTPSWKTAMLVLMVLYPTVMLLSRFVGPLFDRLGAEPWLAMWLSQVASVSMLQWLLMPFAVRRMRRWLDPVDGAGLRVTLRGAAVVLGVYAVTLTVFAMVTWLQYWDFGD